MAAKRNRGTNAARNAPAAKETTEAVMAPETVTAQASAIVPPTEHTNQFDSVLRRLEEQEKRAQQQEETIRSLKRQVAEAKGDISEESKDSKRKYGYEQDGHTRRKEEMFEYGYSVIVHERKERAVLRTETIGRPSTHTNYNSGKRIDSHDIKVFFHDGTETEMDALEYITQKFVVKQLVPDFDIRVENGEKFFTFDTEKFGKFEISQKFVN